LSRRSFREGRHPRRHAPWEGAPLRQRKNAREGVAPCHAVAFAKAGVRAVVPAGKRPGGRGERRAVVPGERRAVVPGEKRSVGRGFLSRRSFREGGHPRRRARGKVRRRIQ